LNAGINAFIDQFSSRVHRISKYRHISPFAYTIRKGFRGNITNPKVLLMYSPSRFSIRGVFATNDLYYFIGSMQCHNGKWFVKGSYQLTPVFRYFLLFFVGGVLLACLFVFLLLFPVATYAFFVKDLGYEHFQSYFIVVAITCTLILVCVCIYLYGQFALWINRPFKEEMRKFLLECAAPQ
jgi:hypothetical protein